MQKIKKGDMADRMGAAVAAAPTLADRFGHARAQSDHNPALDQPGGSEAPLAPVPAASQGATPVPPMAPSSAVSNDYAGELRLVPLDEIDPNPYNARHIYRTKRILELAASIGANGQDTPGLATIRNGRYILVAGHYRLKALKHLRNRPMLLLVRPDVTDKQLYEMSFRENHEREDETALDNAMSWKELLNKKLYTSETEIADVTGYSLPVINKTMAILALDEAVLAIVQEDPSQFKYSVLYELKLYAEVATVDEVIEMTRGILEGRVSRKVIEDARSKIEQPKPARKTKETPRSYKISREGKDVGSLKTWDSGKVSFEITIPESSERHELINELKERFGLTE